jgi:hypothetical protein
VECGGATRAPPTSHARRNRREIAGCEVVRAWIRPRLTIGEGYIATLLAG